tara:strand:+ start:312 stop:836 length:525 start_codon:yes stop_codon:yes gene_type:complete
MTLPKLQLENHIESLYDTRCSFAPSGEIKICLNGDEPWANYHGHSENMGISHEFRTTIEEYGWWAEWQNPEVLMLYPNDDFETKYPPGELIGEWNRYVESIQSPSDYVYWNNDESFEELGITIRQVLTAAKHDRYDWDHRFLTLDGYSNPMSSNNLDDVLDMDELEDWMYTVTK